jgi:radical SAM family uncharacterized protein
LEAIDKILAKVQKPARYTGGEYNQIIKEKTKVDVRIALCFPDVYEIGMSNLGLRIIYGVLNNIENIWCERVFSPWADMEEQLRENNIPLYGLESYDAIKDFDIIAFSLGYELSYTNMLNMLDLAGVPLRSNERNEKNPLVIAGGSCSLNPNPISDFIDLFVIGDGEEVIVELINLYNDLKVDKESKANKTKFLEKSSILDGVYVPFIHDKTNTTISKRVVKNLDTAFFPTRTIVPSMSIVHDRAVLELFRGCYHKCKFCQAGFTEHPVRSRSVETLTKQGIEEITNSGYDEIGLLSLSTGDYKDLSKLCDNLLKWCEPRKVSLSLPSLRASDFNVELLKQVQKVRKSSLTFAPEAGSQRLREYINKNITEGELLDACKLAFENGWNSVKLYFMLGLPTETDDDVLAIAKVAHNVLNTWREYTNNKKRGVRITLSTSCFIPKPHTPFEREEQISVKEYLRRVSIIKNSIQSKMITYNWHSPDQGYIEAALSRGDKGLGAVIETAWRGGARFDSWSECFSLQTWLNAFDECNLNIDDYATRKREENETLPWSFIAVRD